MIFKIGKTSQVEEDLHQHGVVHDGLRYVNGLALRHVATVVLSQAGYGGCCWGFGGILHSRGNATRRQEEKAEADAKSHLAISIHPVSRILLLARSSFEQMAAAAPAYPQSDAIRIPTSGVKTGCCWLCWIRS